MQVGSLSVGDLSAETLFTIHLRRFPALVSLARWVRSCLDSLNCVETNQRTGCFTSGSQQRLIRTRVPEFALMCVNMQTEVPTQMCSANAGLLTKNCWTSDQIRSCLAAFHQGKGTPIKPTWAAHLPSHAALNMRPVSPVWKRGAFRALGRLRQSCRSSA